MTDSPCIGEKWRDGYRALLGLIDQAPAHDSKIDPHAVRDAVERHAARIGLSDSNTTAAISYGLRWGTDTLMCVRMARLRAEKLRNQQPDPPRSAA